MTRLIAFGCSHTQGIGLPDIYHLGCNTREVSKHSWSAQAAKILDCPTINQGCGGASNTAIWNRATRFRYEPEDIVVIQWSDHARHEHLLPGSSFPNDLSGTAFMPGYLTTEYDELFGGDGSNEREEELLGGLDPNDVSRGSYMYYRYVFDEYTSAMQTYCYVSQIDQMIKNRVKRVIHVGISCQNNMAQLLDITPFPTYFPPIDILPTFFPVHMGFFPQAQDGSHLGEIGNLWFAQNLTKYIQGEKRIPLPPPLTDQQ